jgi:hypothetical protein
MKFFMGFLLVCFFCGWLLPTIRLRYMLLLLMGLSVMLMLGYFFLKFI